MDFVEQGLDSLVDSGWTDIRLYSKEKYRYRIKYVFTFTNSEGERVATQVILKPDNVILQKHPRRLVIIDPQ